MIPSGDNPHNIQRVLKANTETPARDGTNTTLAKVAHVATSKMNPLSSVLEKDYQIKIIKNDTKQFTVKDLTSGEDYIVEYKDTELFQTIEELWELYYPKTLAKGASSSSKLSATARLSSDLSVTGSPHPKEKIDSRIQDNYKVIKKFKERSEHNEEECRRLDNLLEIGFTQFLSDKTSRISFDYFYEAYGDDEEDEYKASCDLLDLHLLQDIQACLYENRFLDSLVSVKLLSDEQKQKFINQFLPGRSLDQLSLSKLKEDDADLQRLTEDLGKKSPAELISRISSMMQSKLREVDEIISTYRISLLQEGLQQASQRELATLQAAREAVTRELSLTKAQLEIKEREATQAKAALASAQADHAQKDAEARAQQAALEAAISQLRDENGRLSPLADELVRIHREHKIDAGATVELFIRALKGEKERLATQVTLLQPEASKVPGLIAERDALLMSLANIDKALGQLRANEDITRATGGSREEKMIDALIELRELYPLRAQLERVTNELSRLDALHRSLEATNRETTASLAAAAERLSTIDGLLQPTGKTGTAEEIISIIIREKAELDQVNARLRDELARVTSAADAEETSHRLLMEQETARHRAAMALAEEQNTRTIAGLKETHTAEIALLQSQQQAEIERLGSEFKLAISALQSEHKKAMAALESDHERATAALQAAHALALSQIQTEKASLNDELLTLRTAYGRIQSALQAPEGTIPETHIAFLKESKAALEAQVLQLNATNHSQQEALAENAAKISAQEARIGAFEASLKKAQTQIDKKDMQLLKLILQKASLEKQTSALLSQNSRMLSDKLRLEQELAQKDSYIRVLINANIELQEDLQKTRSLLETTDAAKAKAEAQLLVIQTALTRPGEELPDIETIAPTIIELGIERDTLRAQVESHDQERLRLSRLQASQETRLAFLGLELETARKANTASRALLSKKNEEVARLQSSLRSAEEEKRSLISSHELTLASERARFAGIIQEKDAALEKIRADATKAAASLNANLASLKASYGEENAALIAQIEGLRADLASSEETAADKTREAAGYYSQLLQKLSALDTAQNQLLALSNKHEAQRVALESSMDLCAKLKALTASQSASMQRLEEIIGTLEGELKLKSQEAIDAYTKLSQEQAKYLAAMTAMQEALPTFKQKLMTEEIHPLQAKLAALQAAFDLKKEELATALSAKSGEHAEALGALGAATKLNKTFQQGSEALAQLLGASFSPESGSVEDNLGILASKIAALQSEKQELISRNHDLREDLRASLEERKIQHAQFQETLQAMMAEIGKQTSLKGALAEEKKATAIELRKALERITGLSQTLQEHDTANAQLILEKQQVIDLLIKDKSDLERSVEAGQNRVSSLAQQLAVTKQEKANRLASQFAYKLLAKARANIAAKKQVLLDQTLLDASTFKNMLLVQAQKLSEITQVPLAGKLETAEDLIANFAIQNEAITSKLKQAQQDWDVALGAYDSALALLQESDAKNAKLTSRLLQANDSLRTLQLASEEAQKALEKAGIKGDNPLKDQIALLAATRDGLQNEVDRKIADLAGLKATLAQLQSTLTEKTSANAALLAEKTGIQAAFDAYKKQQTQIQAQQKQEQTEANQALAKAFNALRTALGAKKSEIESLRARIALLASQHADEESGLRAAHAAALASLESASREALASAQQQGVGALEAAEASAKAALIQLATEQKEELARLQGAHAAAISEQQGLLAQQTSRAEAAESSAANLAKAKAALELQVAQDNAKIAGLTSANDTLQAEVARVTPLLSAAEATVAAQKSSLIQLQAELERTQAAHAVQIAELDRQIKASVKAGEALYKAFLGKIDALPLRDMYDLQQYRKDFLPDASSMQDWGTLLAKVPQVFEFISKHLETKGSSIAAQAGELSDLRATLEARLIDLGGLQEEKAGLVRVNKALLADLQALRAAIKPEIGEEEDAGALLAAEREAQTHALAQKEAALHAASGKARALEGEAAAHAAELAGLLKDLSEVPGDDLKSKIAALTKQLKEAQAAADSARADIARLSGSVEEQAREKARVEEAARAREVHHRKMMEALEATTAQTMALLNEAKPQSIFGQFALNASLNKKIVAQEFARSRMDLIKEFPKTADALRTRFVDFIQAYALLSMPFADEKFASEHREEGFAETVAGTTMGKVAHLKPTAASKKAQVKVPDLVFSKKMESILTALGSNPVELKPFVTSSLETIPAFRPSGGAVAFSGTPTRATAASLAGGGGGAVVPPELALSPEAFSLEDSLKTITQLYLIVDPSSEVQGNWPAELNALFNSLLGDNGITQLLTEKARKLQREIFSRLESKPAYQEAVAKIGVPATKEEGEREQRAIFETDTSPEEKTLLSLLSPANLETTKKNIQLKMYLGTAVGKNAYEAAAIESLTHEITSQNIDQVALILQRGRLVNFAKEIVRLRLLINSITGQSSFVEVNEARNALRQACTLMKPFIEKMIEELLAKAAAHDREQTDQSACYLPAGGNLRSWRALITS